MKSILFIVIISIILIFSNINCLFALNEGQIYKNAQKLYDVGAKLMIQDKFTEAKDFFIYCESESMKCKNEELALKANYMIKNCNIMLNLANINEKAPRNELLPVEKLILIQDWRQRILHNYIPLAEGVQATEKIPVKGE